MPTTGKPHKYWQATTHTYVCAGVMLLGRVDQTDRGYEARDVLHNKHLGTFPSLEEAQSAVEKVFADFDLADFELEDDQ